MRLSYFETIPENVSAENIFKRQLDRGGKTIIQLVFSCGIPDDDGFFEDDIVAVIDREDSPNFDSNYSMYGFPFNAVTYTTQNCRTANDSAVAKTKNTFYGGRKLPIEEVEPIGIFRIGDNRGESTLFLPYSVHIDLAPNHPFLEMSQQFKHLSIGNIIWDTSTNVKRLISAENDRVKRSSSARELEILKTYRKYFTEIVTDNTAIPVDMSIAA